MEALKNSNITHRLMTIRKTRSFILRLKNFIGQLFRWCWFGLTSEIRMLKRLESHPIAQRGSKLIHLWPKFASEDPKQTFWITNPTTVDHSLLLSKTVFSMKFLFLSHSPSLLGRHPTEKRPTNEQKSRKNKQAKCHHQEHQKHERYMLMFDNHSILIIE